MPTAMLAHVEPKAYLDSVNLLLTALAVDTASTREPAQAISDFRRPRFDEAQESGLTSLAGNPV